MSEPKGYRHRTIGIGEDVCAAILRRAIAEGRAEELMSCLIDGGMATVDMKGPGILLAPPDFFTEEVSDVLIAIATIPTAVWLNITLIRWVAGCG